MYDSATAVTGLDSVLHALGVSCPGRACPSIFIEPSEELNQEQGWVMPARSGIRQISSHDLNYVPRQAYQRREHKRGTMWIDVSDRLTDSAARICASLASGSTLVGND